MKISSLFAATALLFASIQSSQGSVLIQFNAFFSGGVSSNLANYAGVVSNGMSYGIIVDGSGNGFLNNYGPFSTALDAVSQLTGPGGVVTDDRLVMASDLTSDTTFGGGPVEGDFVTPGGNGGVYGINNLAYFGEVNTGDHFELVWFDPDGVHAGILTDPSFILPPDGSVELRDAPFIGIDPIRPANQLIPEPSTWFMGLAGMSALFRRKRKA